MCVRSNCHHTGRYDNKNVDQEYPEEGLYSWVVEGRSRVERAFGMSNIDIETSTGREGRVLFYLLVLLSARDSSRAEGGRMRGRTLAGI